MQDGCLRLVAPILLLSLAASTAADDSGLAACASIEDDNARLDCYDSLAASSVIEDEGTPPTTPGSDALDEISDDFGAEQLKTSDAGHRSAQPVRVSVVSCTKDRVGKYYFRLDNGQVWKQKDSDRLRYKECAFGAAIVRDGFGYKMTIDGRKGRVRVSRIR